MTQEVDLKNLPAEFHRLKDADKRLAGEIAYVIAVKAKKAGDTAKSQYYAFRCLKIFNELNIQTLEDASPRLGLAIDDVFLPDLIHERVVKQRFRQLNIL